MDSRAEALQEELCHQSLLSINSQGGGMMSASWTCPQCGGTSNHFSRSRNALVCDTCGSIVQTEAERKADIDFERSMALAGQHLRVGNWDEAKRLIKPFCSSRPADKQLYLMLLVAVTKAYSDYLVNNEASRREAFDYWDKLVRLGCVNETMKSYARRREQYIYEEKSILSAKRGIAIGISILVTFIAVCLLSTGSGAGSFFLVLAIVSWIISVKYMQKLSRNTMISRSNNHKSHNPFT